MSATGFAQAAMQKLADLGLLREPDEAYLREAIRHALDELRAGCPHKARQLLEFAIREQGQ